MILVDSIAFSIINIRYSDRPVCDEIERPFLDGFDRFFDGAERGQDDEWDILLFDLFKEGESVHIGKLKVGNDSGKRFFLQQQ